MLWFYVALRWKLSIYQTVYIYTIICLKSVAVRKLHVAILAPSPRETSQTDRIVWKHILSWVRVSVRPRIFLYAKKTQNHSRPHVVYFDRLCAHIYNYIGSRRTEPTGWRSGKASGYKLWHRRFRSAGIRVQTPCREQWVFSLLLFAINKAYS